MVVYVVSGPVIRGSSVCISFLCMFDMYNTALFDNVTLLAVLTCQFDFSVFFL